MSSRDDALDLIERINELNPTAAEYLLTLFAEVANGETRLPADEQGRKVYQFADNLDRTFLWSRHPIQGLNWSRLHSEDCRRMETVEFGGVGGV